MAVVRYDCYLPQGDRCDVGGLYLRVGEDRDSFPAVASGIVGMSVGGVRELKVSPQLAYRERAKNPTIPPAAALRYEVTLLSLEQRGVHEADSAAT
jgi:FKBP-type peptidyl-prolyl cis-trans isomerase